MAHNYKLNQDAVPGPDGNMLTLASLPAPDTKRWVPRRKAEVVAAVRGGLLSLDDACARYALTVEEFLGWQRNVERYGLKGLRATQMQEHRARERSRERRAQEHRPHA